MKAERIEAVWIEEHHMVSIDELGEHWGLNRNQLHEFVALGVLEPARNPSGSGSFTLESLSVVQTACRLQQDLELDTHAVGVVLDLLQRLHALENELGALRARLPGGAAADDDAPEADVIL